MFSLLLLVLLGLAGADTDPRDFSRLCSSTAPGGECPVGWTNVEGDCIMFAGWDKTRAQEMCRENRAEYMEYVMLKSDTDSATRHSLPVCLVRRSTQCSCGRANREDKIVGGISAEKHEYPWQGKRLN